MAGGFRGGGRAHAPRDAHIGDRPTIADCCLVPQVYNAKRFGVDMAPYPNIERINADCLALEAFDKARPELQPDAPK